MCLKVLLLLLTHDAASVIVINFILMLLPVSSYSVALCVNDAVDQVLCRIAEIWGFIPRTLICINTERCYAERGIAVATWQVVRLSVTLTYCGHIV